MGHHGNWWKLMIHTRPVVAYCLTLPSSHWKVEHSLPRPSAYDLIPSKSTDSLNSAEISRKKAASCNGSHGAPGWNYLKLLEPTVCKPKKRIWDMVWSWMFWPTVSHGGVSYKNGDGWFDKVVPPDPLPVSGGLSNQQILMDLRYCFGTCLQGKLVTCCYPWSPPKKNASQFRAQVEKMNCSSCGLGSLW